MQAEVKLFSIHGGTLAEVETVLVWTLESVRPAGPTGSGPNKAATGGTGPNSVPVLDWPDR